MGVLSNLRINRVVVLGVRTAEQSKIFTTVNSTVYCLMIEYEGGHRKLVECGTKEMEKYLSHVYVP